MDEDVAEKLLHDQVVAKLLSLLIRILVEAKREKITRSVFAGADGILLQADLFIIIVRLQVTEAVVGCNFEDLNVIQGLCPGSCQESNVSRRQSVFVCLFLLLFILWVAVIGRVCV